jgi:hypothetical protein
MVTEFVRGEIVDGDGELRRLGPCSAVNFALLTADPGTRAVVRLLGWANWP